MSSQKDTFKEFFKKVDDKDNKKLNKKTPKNKMYGGSNTMSPSELANNAGDGGAGAVGESLLSELTVTRYVEPKKAKEEEDESKDDKFKAARNIFQMMLHRPDMQRQDIIKAFTDKIGVTDSTATSYYQRLAKQAGITGPGNHADKSDHFDGEEGDHLISPDQEIPTEPVIDPDTEWEDDDRAGVIRTVPGAHLVYKRQQEDGTFEELWLYKIGDDFNQAINIRKDILAGTDIPPNKTKSEDGSQKYTITTMGDGQIVSVTGLPQ